MTKFNAILFAASMSADLETELDELDELITMCNHGADKVDELVKQYRHIHSLLQGVDYMIDFIEDGEAKDELKEVSANWHSMLESNWAIAMKHRWTKKLGLPVKIETEHGTDKSKTYHVTVGDRDTFTTNSDRRVSEYLYSMMD